MSDLPALAEIIEDGKTGRLYPAGDTNALAKIISELLTDRRDRERLGTEAKKWIEENRSWEIVIQKVPSAYQQLAAVVSDV